MKNVRLNMTVYLVTVDDLQKGMSYHVCASLAGAENLFKKIVRENYFDPEEDTEEDLKDACLLTLWESKHGDVVKYSKCTAVADGENLIVVR